MYEVEVKLINATGIHARPATLFVKEANKFSSEIKVIKGEKEINGKSMIAVLSMGAVKGDIIKISANGEDEKEAVEAIKQLIENKFGEA